jgi:hypothetical protein
MPSSVLLAGMARPQSSIENFSPRLDFLLSVSFDGR